MSQAQEQFAANQPHQRPPATAWWHGYARVFLHRHLRLLLPTGSALSLLQSRYAQKPKNPV